MKTPIKIILLVVCTLVAIGGILFFMKTRVSPPSDVPVSDQYTLALTESCKGYTPSGNIDDSRIAYLAMLDKVTRYMDEEVVEKDKAVELAQLISGAYGDAVSKYGFGIFNSSSWPEANLSKVQSLIGESRDLKVDGRSIVSPEVNARYNEITGVIDEYRGAQRIAQMRTYTNNDAARNAISKADSYRNKQYLKNNSELVASLGRVRENLANSHYSQIQAKANAMADYMYISESRYNDLKRQYNSLVSSYDNADFYGSAKKSISSIKDRVLDIDDWAEEYYQYEY